MKKKPLLIGGILLLSVLALNTSWGIFYFDFGRCYSFSTLHGEYYGFAYENMAPTSADIQRSFKEFREKNPQTQDTVLYRLFKRNPLHVWNWGAYFTHPRYQLPYLEPGKVQYRTPRDPMKICD